MTADPLAPLMDLPGVAEAAEHARDALGRVHRHRANLRGWPVTAAEAALRAARASSVLDGGALQLDEDPAVDPVFAGALRVAQALEGGATALVGVWQRAPLQALARMHSLAAADLVDDDQLGRPRLNPEVSARLDLMSRLVTGGSTVPAPILAAVAHGELLAVCGVRQCRRRGRPRGRTVGDDRNRTRPARARRSRGVLDAPGRGLPRSCARFRVRDRQTA